jgi:four helix bundle protein
MPDFWQADPSFRHIYWGQLSRRMLGQVAEFVAKLGIVLEEADETTFWLELMQDAGIFPDQKLQDLVREANELVAIFVTSVRTAKGFTSAI